EDSPRDRRDSIRARDRPWSKELTLHAAAHLPGNLEVIERSIRTDAAARRAVDKSQLHEIRLVDLFDGVGLFIDGSCNGVHSHWAPTVLFEQSKHDLLIDFVEAKTVYF